jgi:hypothetical protein
MSSDHTASAGYSTDEPWTACCSLVDGHDGPCAYLCSHCQGSGRCSYCRGTGGYDDVQRCTECDAGHCPYCDEGLVSDE